jgi:hypothetical protein
MKDRQHRSCSFLGATIVLDGEKSVFDCIVKDISETGARLTLQNDLPIPEAFGLRIVDGREFECVVRWGRINALGVSFSNHLGQDPK